MTRFHFMLPALMSLAALVWIGGCDSSKPVEPQAGAPAASPSKAADDSGDKTAQAFSALSVADRAAAKAQETCPVSDERLGQMGTPFKVKVKDRDVFLCCEGCKADIESDPDKYLAKLKK